MSLSIKSIFAGVLGCVFTLLLSFSASATVVKFETVLGDFEVNLYDEATPETVANFLAYVNAGAYTNTVFHRSMPGFVLQGGGFVFDQQFPLVNVETNAAVKNEPKFSNVRGTIAMAKLGGNANSATSQWFFNLDNNSVKSGATLDTQNGGFTVFGHVLGNGMEVIDAIAALPRFQISSSLTDFPLNNYTSTDATNNVALTQDHLVLITRIDVIDSNVSTYPELVPVPNTALGADNGNTTTSSSSSGGVLAWFGLMMLTLLVVFKRK